MPAPVAAVPLALKAPPAGAVESACAVKLKPVLLRPALFCAVTEPVWVAAVAVKV